jgi:hypothetical protein
MLPLCTVGFEFFTANKHTKISGAIIVLRENVEKCM